MFAGGRVLDSTIVNVATAGDPRCDAVGIAWAMRTGRNGAGRARLWRLLGEQRSACGGPLLGKHATAAGLSPSGRPATASAACTPPAPYPVAYPCN